LSQESLAAIQYHATRGLQSSAAALLEPSPPMLLVPYDGPMDQTKRLPLENQKVVFGVEGKPKDCLWKIRI